MRQLESGGRVREEQVLTLHGRTVRAVLDRDPDGAGKPVLLLCNGIGAGLEVLEPFVAALPPGRDVLRFDAPGAGRSPAPAIPARFPALAQLAAGLVRQSGHDRADVLGISWGGALAQQIAFSHPRLCRRLILVSTATGALMVPAHPRVLWRMTTPRRYRDADYAARVAGTLYGGTARRAPAATTGGLHAGTRPGSLGYLHQLYAGAGWTSLPWLPLIRQRTLVIAGTDDPIIPVANARILSRLLPHATLHLHGGGHLALVSEAAELAPEVAAFLDAAD